MLLFQSFTIYNWWVLKVLLLICLLVYWASLITQTVNAVDPGLIPGSGRCPWRRKWLLNPVFFSGESLGPRSWFMIYCSFVDVALIKKLGKFIIYLPWVAVAQSCLTLGDPMTAAHQASLSFTISWSLLKHMSIESVMPSNHLILCHPLLLLPSIFPSIRVFSSEWALHIRWPKYQSFSFSISPSNEYSGVISFRMNWFDLLAVPGTLKSLVQHYSSKASFLWCSAFFIVLILTSIHVAAAAATAAAKSL